MKAFSLFLQGKEIILDPRRAAYAKDDNILCLNDFHFGFTTNGKRGQITAAIVRGLLDTYLPKQTVLVGDYVVSDRVATFPEFRDDFRQILKEIAKRTQLTLIRGNIDFQFEERVTQYDLVEEYHAGGMTFLHGHQDTVKERIERGEFLMLGHGHPTMRHGGKLLHCFLTYGNTLLLPTISPWSTMGNDVFVYYKKSFPSNYFYFLDWNIFVADGKTVTSLGRRSENGSVQAQRSLTVARSNI